MLPLAAPLKSMEHCTQPFLDQCDTNDDGEISLEEWGTCLGLEKGIIIIIIIIMIIIIIIR